MEDTAHIDTLISKFLTGEASPEEAMQLEDWKEQSTENETYYKSFEKVFVLTGNKNLQEINTDLAWKKIQASEKNKVEKVIPLFQFKQIYRIAAAVLFISIGFSSYFYLRNNSKTQNLSFKSEETKKKITLSDSSEMVLNAHSTLIVENGFNTKHRNVKLQGAAYFKVVHSEVLPFTISVNNLTIKDIGTAFFVNENTNNDTISINVDEGEVELSSGNNKKINLIAGEKAFFLKSTKEIIKNEAIDKKTILNFDFNNANLIEVVTQLNQAYQTNILLENEKLNNCTITTKFNNEKLEVILMIITETLGLTFENTPKGYLIKGEKCAK